MNRSTSKWSLARRLLHAFAEAGQPSAGGLQLFLGPNGGLMWTDAAQVDRTEPSPGMVFLTLEKSAPVDEELPKIVRLPEPAGSRGFTPVEAPASH